MNKLNRIISMLLTVLMILGSFTTALALGVFSASAEEAGNTPTGGEVEPEAQIGEVDYMNDVFLTPEEKLKTMKLEVTKDGYELYVDSRSGEVAFRNTKTGEVLFTNPYDIALSTGNEETKKEILSQIIVTFTDNTGIERIFTSYEEAASRGQIVIEAIKGGIRVEYAIGRESSKVLVPRLISYERFEEMIVAPLYETFGDELYNPRTTNPELFDVQKVLSYFIIYAIDKLPLSNSERNLMDSIYGGLYDNLKTKDAQRARTVKKFPIVETMPILAFDPDASAAELTKAEEIITKYCPEYTYEELEYDHLLTEYKSDDKNPPVFRMALEYTIDADGLSVRLPANGIRFNESLYTLTNLQVLPYMGAGNCAYAGYNFFPDGAGTLFDFEELNTNKTYSVSGKVYGTDFAYHEISGTYQKTIRYPVFGIVEETKYYSYKEYNADGDLLNERIVPGSVAEALMAIQNGETQKSCVGKQELLKAAWAKIFGIVFDDSFTIADYKPDLEPLNNVITEVVDKRGFVAIIEEGDALASLSTYHAGALSDYNTIKMQFTPRPQDSYNLSDSISVGTDTEWTVVSDRKYVGNYKIKYIMLSDTKDVEEEKTYDTSWFGMAVAYRDYLTGKGIITKKTGVDEDIPLYIETFGALETTEKILSVPVTVMAPLTTFDNVETIYNELSDQGMKNINFKLTGYANGGMQYTIPANLKFEKAVGGNEGFQALLDAANEVNSANNGAHFGVFPDFDFAYSAHSELFDGYNALEHNAKTIDGRYASKRIYSATQQKYVNYFEMVISPAYFSEFYEKLAGNYFGKYTNVNGISLSTLGGALNSDFDEDEPYNREDAKKFTVDAFEYFKTNYQNTEVMTNDGNAYVWKYVDHILGVSLDSSRYNFSSKSVPFIGVVLHGSMSFAGEPLNMEGDLNYAILKAIENGASPYFILSYQNTEALKKDEQLSKYYSIRYDIWAEDIADVYTKLNSAIGDVQDKYITGHAFLEGYRIPDSDELMNDVLVDYLKNLEDFRNIVELAEKELREAVKIARENGRNAEAYAATAILDAIKQYNSQMSSASSSIGFADFDGDEYYNNLTVAYEKYLSAVDKTDKEKYSTIREIVEKFNKSYDECVSAYDALMEKYAIDESAEGYKSLYNDLTKLYDNYASGKINKAVFERSRAMYCAAFALDVAIEGYAEGTVTAAQLKTALSKYAISKVDMSDLDDAIVDYVSGEITDSVKKRINEAKTAYTKAKTDADKASAKKLFDAAVADYANPDSALVSAVKIWLEGDGTTVTEADVIAAANTYKANATSKNKTALDDKIAAYALESISESDVIAYANALVKARTNFALAEGVWDATAGKIRYRASDKLSATAFNKAKTTYENAVKTFEEKMAQYLAGEIKTADFNKAIKAMDTARQTYQTALNKYSFDKNITATKAEANFNSAYAALAIAQADLTTYASLVMDAADVEAAYEKYSAALDSYFTNQAIENAYDMVIDSGFNVTFDYCIDKYLTYESYALMSDWGKMVTQGSPKATEYTKYISYLMTMNKSVSNSIDCVDGDNSLDQDKFVSYHEAQADIDELKDEVKSFSVSVGRYEQYIDACAKATAMEKLGYHEAAADSKEFSDYEKAIADRAKKRNAAIKALAGIDSVSLRNITNTYTTAKEYFDLAVAAVSILEISELKPLNMSIEYEEGREGDITAITNYDEIAKASFIVKQGIDRALAVNNYVVMDKYNAITYGQPALDANGQQRYHNGNKLYTVIDDSGKRLYFTGSLETGYSYYTQAANGTLTVHKISDNFIVKGSNGADIYKYTMDGKSYYYSVDETGYTYYTNYGTDRSPVCIVRDDIKYELSDAPVAYVDQNGNDIGNVAGSVPVYTAEGMDGNLIYVSVDADGIYTRYTFNRAIENCYEASLAVKDYVKNIVANDSFDATFYEDLENKIFIFSQMQSKDEVEEEIVIEEDSKYMVENVVAITYGNADGTAYKTILLNYNNYTVRAPYEYEGVTYEYNIPAYEYVVIVH